MTSVGLFAGQGTWEGETLVYGGGGLVGWPHGLEAE